MIGESSLPVVGFICEYGAVSLPLGHESRITGMEIFATEAEARAFGEAGDYNFRVLEARGEPFSAIAMFKPRAPESVQSPAADPRQS